MEIFLSGSYCISIHALMKRATHIFGARIARHNISIHALMKRATPFSDSTRLTAFYFNPRPHEEGDDITFTRSLPQNISIHALMKRATSVVLTLTCTDWISIHALMKRATVHFAFPKSPTLYFNPRPHEEGDGLGWG